MSNSDAIKRLLQKQTVEVPVHGEIIVLTTPEPTQAMDVKRRSTPSMSASVGDPRNPKVTMQDLDFASVNAAVTTGHIAAIAYCAGLDPEGEEATGLYVVSGQSDGELCRTAMRLCGLGREIEDDEDLDPLSE